MKIEFHKSLTSEQVSQASMQASRMSHEASKLNAPGSGVLWIDHTQGIREERRWLGIEQGPLEPCIICGRPAPYEPEYCCDGRECGCHGMPIDPCVCSQKCWSACMDYIGHEFDERRKLAGIAKHKPVFTV